jgi:hypothetical protein
LTSPLRRTACRNCGREGAADDLDAQRWCAGCRRRVIDRAAFWARFAALAATALVAAWVVLGVRPTRFIIGWMLILAVIYFIVHKIAQRVLFEVIRARGVEPNPEVDG